MKSRIGSIAFGIGVACLAGSAYLYDQARKRTTYTNYSLRVEYQTLPADDEGIKTWIAQQPGVKKATVSRVDNKVSFDITVENSPPEYLGKLMHQCETTGYVGRVGYVGGFGPYR